MGKATGLRITRLFTKPDEDPFDSVTWGTPASPAPDRPPRQVIKRLTSTWHWWGERSGYFAAEADAPAFEDELSYMLVNQMAAPNSPQWFNTGLHHSYGLTGPAQGFWYVDPATGRAVPSPDSYSRPAPRRDVLPPDRRPGGRRHQVGRHHPAGRQDGHPRHRPPRHRGVHQLEEGRGGEGPGPDRRRLWRQIAEAAWACADPGVQFHTTINEWHTCPADGPIRASNPCSEYMFLDNTACNLASLNLGSFFDDDSGTFNIETYQHAIRLWTMVLDVSVTMAHFPSREIAQGSYDYRPLGLGD